MIAQIRGKVAYKDLDHAIIDVNGVGYQVFLSIYDLAEVGHPDEEVTVHIYTYVREDALNLYGFLHPQAKAVFKLLIGISGIGPKLAMSVLSGIEVNEFREAIAANDLRRLKMIPGIGQKTAERIILELKDKNLDFCGPAITTKTATSGLYEDLFSALKNLGYKDGKIESVLEKIRAEQPAGDFHVWLRHALNLIRG